MPKSKKRKKVKKKKAYSRKQVSPKNEITIFKSPFSEVPHEELIKAFIEEGKTHAEKFPSLLSDLENSIAKLNPTDLLSILSFYGLTGFVDIYGNVKQKEGPIIQNHIELIQALLLKNSLDKFENAPAVPPVVSKIVDLCRDVNSSFHMQRLSQLEKIDKVSKASAGLIEELRLSTQYLRNWGYIHEVRRIIKGILYPMDSLIEKKINISMLALIDAFFQLVRVAEERMTEHFKRISMIFKEKTINGGCSKYHMVFSDLLGSPEEDVNGLKELNLSVQDAKLMFLSHSDMRLKQIYTYSIEDIIEFSDKKLAKDALSSVLHKISYKFGDLKNETTEHFFLSNPIWEKPLIRLSENEYFIPIIPAFFSFIYDVIENLLFEDDILKEKYYKCRSDFLENETHRLFEGSFPGAKAFRGSLWKDEKTGKDYENDLMIQIGSFLILIEAKSAKVTAPAKRGAASRIKRTVEDLIVDPSEQSYRFATFLAENKKEHSFPTKSNKFNEINTENIHRILRLNATLDDFGTLQSRVNAFKEAGFIEKNVSLAPTMTIADLNIVFDILNRASEKLHYLIRRNDIENKIVYHGDELDLLGFYLDTGLNLNSETLSNIVITPGFSKKLDDYYEGILHKSNPPKPKLKVNKYWSDIICKIEEREFDRWAELGTFLLCLSLDDQNKTIKMFNIISRNVKKNWYKKNKRNSVICVTDYFNQKNGYALVAYRDKESENRHNLIDDIANQIFQNEEVKFACILGINIDKNHYPYSIITLARNSY